MNRFWVYGLSCIFILMAAAANATTIVLPTDEQLIAKSAVIVDGTVLSSSVVDLDGALWTETEVSVARTIKGSVPSSITVREIGGQSGDRITKIFGTAELTPGERVLLFLEPSPRGGYRTVDLFVGKFSEARMMNGRRLWMRADHEQDVTLLDADLQPMHAKNVQRDAVRFETFVFERLAGRPGAKNYGVENPVLARDTATPSGGRDFQSNFTLIGEPTVYRWTRFDSGQSATWYHSGSQSGYSGGGTSELQAGMTSWTSYAEAKIYYTYSGARSGSMGGLNTPNGVNEVLFGDPLNEIAGTWNQATGGVVGTGGFNGVSGSATWTAPFAADATHPAGAMQSWTIIEGNLTIQDGVSPGKGISSTRLAEILAHEFGHTLGFGHSLDATALMYASVTGLGPSLRSDDQLAARWLYPNGGSTPPPPQAPNAPSDLRATAGSSFIDLTWQDNASNESGQSIYLAVGNGSFDKIGDVSANAESARVTGVTSGTYRLYVVAFNGAGASAPSNTVSVTLAAAPVANFSFTPQSGTANQTNFTFYDESTGGVSARQWNFGDGATSTAAVATHVFANPGQYTVTLSVSGAGGSSQTSRTISVFGAVNASFVWSPMNPQPGEIVQFTDQSTGAPSSWSWSFGDGTTSTQQNPSKQFAANGTYNVTLTVVRGSESSSTTQSIVVSTGSPVTPNVVASFSISPTSPVTGSNVTFTDLSSGSPAEWSWSFGDGATSTAQHPTHVYAAPGTYTVNLTASKPASSSSVSKQIVVTQAQAYRSLISVAAQTSGVGGTSWRTELTLFNAGAEGANLTLRFLPAGGGNAVTRSVFLAPKQAVMYENALLDLFSIGTGAGALTIEASSAGTNANIRISSRTYTTDAAGTYGQSVPDVEPSALQQTLYVTGIKSGDAFRTNVGLVNRASVPVGTTLTLYSATGSTTSSKSLTLPANSFQQLSLATLFPDVEGRTFDVLSMRMASEATDAVSAYASVVDNATQDPIYIQAVPQASGGRASIPVVGRAPGANGTFWRSDVTFFNPTTARMILSLAYGGSSKTLILEGGQTRVYDDVLSAFGQTAGSGRLEVSWTSISGPVVTSRTYTTVESGGTYGQSIDPVAQFANEVFVPGLRNDASYRTNVGFVNGGGETETFTVIALSAPGIEVGRATLTLAPGAQSQSALASLFPGANGIFTVQVQGDGNALLFAYGSMIDNRSGDPVFYAGR